MKTIKRICQFILLVTTIFLWVFLIGGADSLMENGILFLTMIIVLFATYLCHLCIRKEDIEEILHTKLNDNEI